MTNMKLALSIPHQALHFRTPPVNCQASSNASTRFLLQWIVYITMTEIQLVLSYFSMSQKLKSYPSASVISFSRCVQFQEKCCNLDCCNLSAKTPSPQQQQQPWRYGPYAGVSNNCLSWSLLMSLLILLHLRRLLDWLLAVKTIFLKKFEVFVWNPVL